MWDAAQYLKYSGERARPFFDLVAQVKAEDAVFIADLGCGPGNLTRTLINHWPEAHVIGVDNCPAMLEKAQQGVIPGRLDYVEADLREWTPAQPLDLIVSSAALQWVGDHDRVLVRLAGMLVNGGTLAVQLPYHFQNPAHLIIESTLARTQWRHLKNLGLSQQSVSSLTYYIERLHDLGFEVDAWQTTYMHILEGDNPVLEWFKGTALRPYLERQSEQEQKEFLGEIGRQLQAAYPARRGKTLMPFPRLFFVAVKK